MWKLPSAHNTCYFLHFFLNMMFKLPLSPSQAVVSITLMSEDSMSLGSDHLKACIRRSTIILTHIHVFSFWKEKSAFIQIKAPPVAVMV